MSATVPLTKQKERKRRSLGSIGNVQAWYRKRRRGLRNHPEPLGTAKQLQVKRDTQGNVLLWRDQTVTPLPLTAEEALELRFWLEQQQPERQRFLQPSRAQPGIERQELPDWARDDASSVQHECRPNATTAYLLMNEKGDAMSSQPG